MTNADPLDVLQEALGCRFRDPALLRRALTHSSFVNESPEAAESNEVLEYLGDAVLDMIVAEVLVGRVDAPTEGMLTRLRAALVAEGSLAKVAVELGLGPHLRLGKGEEAQGGRERPGLLADALEAIVGAAHLDGGLEASRAVVLRLFGVHIDAAVRTHEPDPKSRLQEVVQARRHITPTYRVLRAWGPDHERFFEVGCLVGEEVRGIGVGRSKKEATMAAAASALRVDERDASADPGTPAAGSAVPGADA
jgi:ribonuclease-3